jgi:hypothetical protein
MSDKKISQLTALTGANTAADDLLAIVDTNAAETKKITVDEIQKAPLSSGTANGVAYLNGSKVLTTGSALTFDGSTLTNAGNIVALGGDFSGQGAAGYVQLRAGSSDSNTMIIRGASAGARFEYVINGAERMRIDSSGNVGIGTTAPIAKFVVSNGGANGYEFDPANGFISSYNRSTSLWTAVKFRAGSYTWNISNSNDAMTLTSAGEVLIGTTTDNGAYLLQVNSQIYATNATIATSDARLKENIQPISNALATIEKVKAVTFDFKQGTDYNFDTVNQTGFIAQELQEALATESYKDSVVKECGPYLGVAYEKMVPVLVAAIQELKAEVDALKAQINQGA